ncbi:MAG: LysM peptidoglycan-binding domain-containing protein [Cytophagales bacterium]|nr:LysM peptidoglycan-binding domain-containing protein [Cytophagales bacterium]
MNGKTFNWNRLAVMLAVIACSMEVMVAQEIKVVAPEIGGFEYDAMPDVTYDEIADRMACLENTIPLVFNDRVKSFVDYFTIKNRDYTVEVLNRKERYFKVFEPILAKYDMPDELKYLSIVESGLRTNAISRANAVGLWQFISSTGKMYGLKGNWYTDDRMDPYQATDAAARHLQDLYNMFGDWELAMAAYNCGPGNVRKAIRRSGYKKRFWEIYRYLPRETRGYVPQFVAMVYVMNHAANHNLFPTEVEYQMDWDTVMVSQYFHLETFANQLNLCLDDLLALNPDIKRGALPEGTLNYALKVPSDLKDTIVANRTFLYDTASKVGKKELEYLARNMPGSTYGRQKQVYRVRSGDVLGTIARRYHVRVSDIKKWNNLRSNLIRVGQRLAIWVLPTYNSQTKNLYATTARTNAARTNGQPDLAGKKVYRVKSGDSLWSISRSTNQSIETIKELNQLKSNNIKPGQALIIGSDK